MRLLDLFCGAGGAAMGYYLAGFEEIVGVDIKPQPHYPFTFVQGDALDYLRRHGRKFDAIHASPPCQLHSVLRHCRPNHDWNASYSDYLPETRELSEQLDIPYIIENVVGSPLEGVTLCGNSFGLRVYRHRRFESNCLLLAPPHRKHIVPVTTDKNSLARFVTVAGHLASGAAFREAMGIDWHMTRDEAAEAIPPAYTEHLGRQLIHYCRKENISA